MQHAQVGALAHFINFGPSEIDRKRHETIINPATERDNSLLVVVGTERHG